MDIRLKYTDIEVGGEAYHICCNMNVLADVQEAFGGDLESALNSKCTVKTIMAFLTAMINDSRDEKGEPPLTIKEVGRMFAPSQLNAIRKAIMPLVTDALKADGDESKNVETTRGE